MQVKINNNDKQCFIKKIKINKNMILKILTYGIWGLPWSYQKKKMND